MITREDISLALARLTQLGPEGKLDPEQLCSVMGIEYGAITEHSHASALNSIAHLMRKMDDDGGVDPGDLVAGFATEHMLGFLLGVTAHHLDSG